LQLSALRHAVLTTIVSAITNKKVEEAEKAVKKLMAKKRRASPVDEKEKKKVRLKRHTSPIRVLLFCKDSLFLLPLPRTEAKNWRLGRQKQEVS
jgi:hypothetical protein